MNPFDNNTLFEPVTELKPCRARFTCNLDSPEIQMEFHYNFVLPQEIKVFSFPSLVLKLADVLFPVPLSYHSAELKLSFILQTIESKMTGYS